MAAFFIFYTIQYALRFPSNFFFQDVPEVFIFVKNIVMYSNEFHTMVT
jgi:hypothetical protein